MTRQVMIEQTINILNQLPDDKVQEVSDFAAFIIKRSEEHLITQSI